MEMEKREKPEHSTAFEPPVRMTDEGGHIHVSIGLPGVVEEQIRIDLEKNTFTLSVSRDEKTFRKVIKIPKGARIFKKKFSDGVLEIFLEKQVR
jgi:HSP20 family molecular chaperone IbpA